MPTSNIYWISLSLHKPYASCNRSLFYNPILIFLWLTAMAVRNVLLFIYRKENYVVSVDTRIYWGDLEYFMGTGTLANSICFIGSIMCITCQLFNYYNYRIGIISRDLSVFQMVSGLIAPMSLGINDMNLVLKLR